MTPGESLDLIVDLERRYPVASWRVSGMAIWPLLRTRLAYELDDYVSLPYRSLPLWRRGLHRLQRSGPREDPERDAISAVDAVCLTMTSARRFRLPEGHCCVFSDPLREALAARGYSTLVLEFTQGEDWRLPRYSPALQIQAWVLEARRGSLRRRLLAAAVSLRAPESLGACLDEVARRSGGGCSISVRSVVSEAQRVRRLATRLRQVLQRASPRVAYVYGYYDFEAFALSLACAELRIPVVDVQHGLQGSEHFAYARWADFSPSGYALLPDVFWTWTAGDATAIEEWARPSGPRAVVGGNLIADIFLRAEREYVRVFDRRLADRSAGASRRVLVALQRGLPDAYRDAIRRAPRDWHWWVRLHPSCRGEGQRIMQALADLPNVDVQLASECPLYSVLRASDVLLSEGSSTAIEASWFGVPSLLTHARLLGSLSHLIEAGWGAHVEVDLLEALRVATPPGAPPDPPAAPAGLESLLEVAGSGPTGFTR